MSRRNAIEEIEARIEYIPRWKLILGVILLIPPISILGMGFLAYELYHAGKRLRDDRTEASSAVDSEADLRAR